ncbi:MAG: galactose oxidase [Leptospiraceae bacterium]|nr:galactose oxidase [Leptospiraceae bacterium]
MKKTKYLLLIVFFFLSCGPSPLHEGNKREDLKAEYFFVNPITPTTAAVNWKCNAPENGIVIYGVGDFSQAQYTLYSGKLQVAILTNLLPNTTYQYQVFCREIQFSERNFLLNRVVPATFTTLASDAQIRNRGIWLLGGIGSDSQPVKQVDLFDPVTLTFTANITSIPTPRAYAQIVSHKNKIYVIGGMTKPTVASAYLQSALVEEYDPYTGIWRTMTDMPSSLLGGVIGSVGEEIVILAGTTTTDMTTGTILNTVYKFRPDVGATGTWSVPLVSANAIFSRVDMGGCVIQGNLFYTGGRLFSDGSLLATTDAYVTASNSTTSLIEASISLARAGAATACYRPSATDAFPLDTAGILVAGGSTLQNVFEPPTAITSTNRYEFRAVGTASNSFTTGPNLPTMVYAPAMEVSYENRKAYVFGGATAINLPTTSVYSIGLSNPTAGPWSTETVTMPIARFAHRAIIINR